MSIINRKEKPYNANINEADNVLGRDSFFEGSIETEQSIKIDGYYQGQSLKADMVIVGKTGRVRANVFANNLILEGALIGDVIANVRVVLQPSSKLVGNISTNELITAKSVEFEGLCRVASSPEVKIKEKVEMLFKDFPSKV